MANQVMPTTITIRVFVVNQNVTMLILTIKYYLKVNFRIIQHMGAIIFKMLFRKILQYDLRDS